MHPTDPKLILITLLVKLGVAAAVSSSLSRSSVFKDLLLSHHRTRRQTLILLALICTPLMLGVWLRSIVPNFLAADISFETVILLGLVLGAGPATLGGIFLALPALLHHEYLALPVNMLVGSFAGGFRSFTSLEDVWSFTPLIDLSLYRWVRRNLSRPHLDRQLLLLLLIAVLELGASGLATIFPRRFFSLHSNRWLVELALCACSPVVVGIPLKIWNAVRIERKLEEQTRLLLEARLDALQRQINPHFLFNTLNSIASLVRFKPELAREMVVKLANILRVLLKDREAFVPFSEELAFTDNYLRIEVVRFGEKLRFVKEISPETEHLVVPSMILQPLIENSIKHGLEPRITGGTVTLRSKLDGEQLLIEVEDDGIGMAPENNAPSPVSGLVRPGTGIGMRNVRERLEVLYGDSASMETNSRPGRGTRVTLKMPAMHAHEAAALSET
ncbi:sensor histidine kinase [Terriglobus sp. 2YAB30_2]|uniref:sensor histidine kinase n=1 Tax=Terriglobus sp. 2YAB30_2 TaxID=3233023 RepID=UPI003F9CD6A7